MTPGILVVDDEEAVAFTLGEILAAEGYRVQEATSVDEALAKIERDTFDAAVLDLNVGAESGLTVLSRLRQTSPHTVALILTGFGSLDTAIQAMREGAFDYLIKPCDVSELKAAIARGIEQRRRAEVTVETDETREELERALAEAQRARDDFLSIAGHELKTPLSALIGWAQLAQRQLARGTTEDAVDKLEAVVRQAQRMARLVEAFTETVSIQHGARALAAETVDLLPLVDTTLADLRRRYPGRTFALTNPGEAVPVRADRRSLALVLDNLLDNAAKFSPDGSAVEVRVQASGKEARISIRDSGVGIAADHLPHIFDRFYQADGDAMTRRFGGIGAGLFVARALIEAQGGRIEAESEGDGRGSTFIVTLPAAP